MSLLSSLLRNRVVRFSGLLLANLLFIAALLVYPDFKKPAISAPEDGGDTCTAATYILGPLPYADSGTTISKTDHYDLPPDVTNPTCTAPVGFAQGSGAPGSLPRGAIYTGTGTGPDAAYQIKMDQTCRLQVGMDPTSSADLALIVYLAQCTSSLTDCVVVSDSGVGGAVETVQFEAAANLDYYIVIDGYSTGGTPPGPSGPYNLTVSEITSPLTGCQPVGLTHPEIAVLDDLTDIPDGTGTVDFGSTLVGTPVQKTFTVNNTGTADLTLVEPISVPAGFSVVTSFGSTTISPGDSTTFVVSLDASSPGTYSGELSFGNNDGDENPFNFTISGTVSAPEISVSESSIDVPDGTGTVDFGSTLVGTPVQKTFTVNNTGTADLTLVEPISVPAGFSVVTSFGSTTISPGDSTTFVISLDASSPGTYSGELSFGNNDGDEDPFNFTISGTVSAPEISVSESSIDVPDGTGTVDFGSTLVGTPVQKTFTVNNTGTADLTLVEPISVPAGFSVVTSFGSTTISPGDSTTFVVSLDASSPGTYSGELSFGNNDGDENPFNFSISGIVEPYKVYLPYLLMN